MTSLDVGGLAPPPPREDTRLSRRLVRIDAGARVLDGLAEDLGLWPGWSLACGVNLRLVNWLCGWLLAADLLPADATPTRVWDDPSRHSLAVLFWSEALAEVPEGEWIPDLTMQVLREPAEGEDALVPELRRCVSGCWEQAGKGWWK